MSTVDDVAQRSGMQQMGATLPPAHDHPAMFSRELLAPLAETIRGRQSVIDPFAGTGRIHVIADLGGVPRSTGIELEPEWANSALFAGPDRIQIVGDSLEVLPSANRMSSVSVRSHPSSLSASRCRALVETRSSAPCPSGASRR